MSNAYWLLTVRSINNRNMRVFLTLSLCQVLSEIFKERAKKIKSTKNLALGEVQYIEL